MSSKNDTVELRNSIARASMKYAGCYQDPECDSMKCRIHDSHWSSTGICFAILTVSNELLINIVAAIDDTVTKSSSV